MTCDLAFKILPLLVSIRENVAWDRDADGNTNIKIAIGMVKIEIGIQIEIDTSNGKILKVKSQVKYLL